MFLYKILLFLEIKSSLRYTQSISEFIQRTFFIYNTNEQILWKKMRLSVISLEGIMYKVC